MTNNQSPTLALTFTEDHLLALVIAIYDGGHVRRLLGYFESGYFESGRPALPEPTAQELVRSAGLALLWANGMRRHPQLQTVAPDGEAARTLAAIERHRPRLEALFGY